MAEQGQETREKRFARIRRAKRILRPLPRRANLHRYPFIKYFSKWAINRPYLWSFKPTAVVPALYVGSILSFMPLMSVQTPLAFFAALIFRCNLTITVALQLITNPFTAVPIYALAYKIGRTLLDFFGTQIAMKDVSDAIAAEANKGTKLFEKVLQAYGATTLGGMVMGVAAGLLLSIIYQFYIYKHPKNQKKDTH